jgi:LytS/YehU family sensor histidine kinase
MFKRIAVMLPAFYLMNAASMSWFYVLLNQFGFSCPTRPWMLGWTIAYGCVMSTFITFVNEGLANWEDWKASITETDKLKNAYQRSRVLGLRGQINPHFLFNCFNTLSGLIQEDGEKAEQFLNEMTHVHRYLLKSEDELLVTLEMETRFAKSYLYLAKERFGEALQTFIQLDEQCMHKLLPPLSMHVILENIIYTNALSKKDPLTISLTATPDQLFVKNSVHEKKIIQNYNVDDGLDNLFEKYKMLNEGEIQVEES